MEKLSKEMICRLKNHSVFLMVGIALLVMLIPGSALAGMIYGTENLTGQNIDWITISDDSNNAPGTGLLYGGTLNVGVEGITNMGNFTIEEGSLFDADHLDTSLPGSPQFQGNVNVGGSLFLKTGGQVKLNQDILNVEGFPGEQWSGRLVMSGESLFDATLSDVTVNKYADIDDSTLILRDNSTFAFGDEYFLKNNSTVTLNSGSSLTHKNTGNSENRGSVWISGGSTLNLDKSNVDLVSGGGPVHGQLIEVKEQATVVAVDSNINVRTLGVRDSGTRFDGTDVDLNAVGINIVNQGDIQLDSSTVNAESAKISDNATMTAESSELSFKDDVSVIGSTLDLDQGTFTFGDKLYVRDSGTVTMTGVTARHQNLGNPDNTGRVIVESNSSMNLTDSSLDLVSGGGPDHGKNLLIKSGGQVTAIDSTITARKVSVDNPDSLYSQTRGNLTAYGLSSGDDGAIQLDNVNVQSDYLSVNGSFSAANSTLDLSNTTGSPRNLSGTDGNVSLTGSTLNIHNGGDIDFMGSSIFTATDSDISAEVFLLRDTASASFSSTTNSSLDINNFKLTGTNSVDITGYDINVVKSDDIHPGRFDVGIEGGSGSWLNLTGSTLDAAYEARIMNGTRITADDSSITFGNEVRIHDSELNIINNSSLAFEDYLVLTEGGSLSVTNSALNHKSDTNPADGTLGSIGVHLGSSLNLNSSTLDLSSGDQQWISIDTGGQLEATGSTITAKEVNTQGAGSLYNQTGGSLVTNIFSSNNNSGIQLSAATVNADSGSVLNNSAMEAVSSDLTFKDDMSIKSGSTMDLDQGTFTFGDKLYVRDSGTVTMTGVTARHQDLGNPDNTGRVIVESNSSMNLTDSSLDLVSGGGPDDGKNLLIKSGGQVTATDSTITARKVSVDNPGSLYSQTRGNLTAYGLSSGDDGEIQLDNVIVQSDYLSVNGSFSATNSTLDLSNTPGSPRNLSGTDGNISLTGSTLNIHNGGDIDFMGSSVFTATDSDISAEVFLLRDTASASFSSTTDSSLDINNFKLTGTNSVDITGYDINVVKSDDIHPGRFDVGIEGGSGSRLNLTGSTLDAAYEARIKSNTRITADDSRITFGNEVRIHDSELNIINNSSLAFEDYLVLTEGGSLSVTNSALNHKSDTNPADGTLGSIGVHQGSSLNLNSSTLDLSSGDQQRILTNSGASVTATDSTITVKKVEVVDTGSKMALFSNSNLTTDSIRVADGGVFNSDNSVVHITGNTTRIEHGGQMFINGGTYEEAGDFIIDGGSLTATDVGITVGRDMIITGDASVDLSITQIFVGDDFLFDPMGTGFFSMGTAMITMEGIIDDDDNGHIFDMADGLFLGGLSVSESVEVLLTGNLVVDNLNFLGAGAINLNGFDLTVSSVFSGELEQITGEGHFYYDPNQPVPEPSTLLLMGLGLLCLSRVRQHRHT